MKKLATIIALAGLALGWGSVMVRATVTDFTADANITVSDITVGSGTGTLLILSGATAESWVVSGGVLTVVNPSISFTVGSADSTVRTIKVSQSGSVIACNVNTTPGTSLVALPTSSGSYTISASTDTSCTSSTGGGTPYVPPAVTPTPTPTPVKETPKKTATPPPATETLKKPVAPPVSETPLTSAISLVPEKSEIIASEAELISQASRDQILSELGKSRDVKVEAKMEKTLVKRLVVGIKKVTSAVKEDITTFVTYGTPSTEDIGANERAGVLTSFKEAFGKLPKTQTDWNDVIKIANGEPPAQVSQKKERQAIASFKVIYGRAPKADDAKDEAAIDYLAYGVRPTEKNLAAEKAAVKTYQSVFRRLPNTESAWSVVRTIAYSGVELKKIAPKKK
jgi:hypothetical protein